MNVKIYKEAVPSFDAAVIPFSDEQLLSTENERGKMKKLCAKKYDSKEKKTK